MLNNEFSENSIKSSNQRPDNMPALRNEINLRTSRETLENESNIISPEKAADMLYDMGWRLSAPINIPLTDTDNEIYLTNIYAPTLEKYWADGVDRRIEVFPKLLGIPETKNIYLKVSKRLNALSEQNISRGNREQLIGFPGSSFLTRSEIRQAWGEVVCYTALCEAEGKPWQWVPTEMKIAIAESIEGNKDFSLTKINPDQTVYGLQDETVAIALAKAIIDNPDQFSIWSKRNQGSENFLEEFKKTYPSAVTQIETYFLETRTFEKISETNRIHPIVRNFFGEAFIESFVERMYPHPETYSDWETSINLLNGSETRREYNEEIKGCTGNLIAQDGTIITPPRTIFWPSSSSRGRVEFVSPQSVEKAIGDSQRSVHLKEKELQDEKDFLQNLQQLKKSLERDQ